MASANTIEITDDNFDSEVKQADLPVLVDFWAEWCRPCQMLTPIIEELAGDTTGKLKVGKLNTDTAPGVRDAFNVNGIPTMILFKGGREVERMVGFMPKHDILSKVNPHLS